VVVSGMGFSLVIGWLEAVEEVAGLVTELG
jgi:hypothetical protein